MDCDSRGTRTRKRASEMICPVCGITVRPGEVESHFNAEMKKLECFGSPKVRKERPVAVADTSEPSSSAPSNSSTAKSESAWTTYQKIRTNRQTRLKVYPKVSIL